MGYHVSIVNKSDKLSTDKILYDFERVINKMTSLGFSVDYEKRIFYKNKYEFFISYDDNSLWLSNPDEISLKVLMEIAESFNDESIVMGDNGEIYKNLSDIYASELIYQEQTESIIKRFIRFLYYRIWFVIPILLAIIKVLFL
ncbi:hypothetical protein BTV20_03900 [Histophilus somni]|uniref:Uncharacterized protein n=3 Tax=Histophilus somni TaxID=731 RepID=A0A9Q6Z0W6_HISSO|nr:hypothetical protein [Histophilus somni]ARU64620.1 hypothetical protein BTV18_03460 [Histophilus somni]ARU66486.1 hypothetical protein BTV19_03895 [Histophilus somni]ARU68360.1 hypothetical protein BTV16_03895 [Histophilus somni]ARU70238.1 hypothetical protein BTV20_03900 [Histophilus somni]ARU72114.1 hypothetical protein BTV17_03890 [Histophilus somni]